MTHLKLTTIHGESWLMHKDNIKSVNEVNTPDAFIESWKKDKVVIITSTELNDKDQKPWQFMVSNTMSELTLQLTGIVHIPSKNKVKVT